MPQESDDRLRGRKAPRTREGQNASPDELVVDVAAVDGIRSPVARQRLAELAILVLAEEDVRRAMISISLVKPSFMARLNSEHLGHKGPTDVITFGLGVDPLGALVADIYICPDVARQQARAQRVSVREEVARLVVHGVLHACGHDHPEEDRERSPMWRRQEELLRRFFLEDSD